MALDDLVKDPEDVEFGKLWRVHVSHAWWVSSMQDVG